MKMVSYLKTLFFKHITYPRYKRAAEKFGDHISRTYSGKCESFESSKDLIDKYLNICVNRNLKPWTYEEMKHCSTGMELPSLREFVSTEEKASWFKQFNTDEHAIRNQFQKNLAVRILNDLRNLK